MGIRVTHDDWEHEADELVITNDMLATFDTHKIDDATVIITDDYVKIK